MTIKELQEKYELKKEDFWQHKSGKWIISHDACEKIAVLENIIFTKPEIHFFQNSICMLGTAYVNVENKNIWSTGEASSDNVKMHGKYYWSIAEKRLKDRLILKLIDAYQYGIYSDSEAEDFRKNKNENNEDDKKDIIQGAVEKKQNQKDINF